LFHFSVGVWKWYPHGEKWLEAVQKYGKDAVDRATSQHYYTLDGEVERRSAFHSLPAPASAITGSGNSQITDVSKIGFAIFYHLSADSDRHVIKEQLLAADALGQKLAQNIPLFYSVVGGANGTTDSTEELLSWCKNTPNSTVTCHALPPFSARYEGETLRQLHDFCQNHPNSTVSYVQSDLPPYMKPHISDISHQHNLLVHLSRAALNSQCVASVRSNGTNSSTCNTCGLVFYKLWTLLYPGNMFTASCEYINELLPPKVFEERMVEYVKSAMLARLLGTVLSRVFIAAFPRKDVNEAYPADPLEVWGLDRFSVDFWLGSHPRLNPCDVSGNVTQNLSYWQSLPAQASENTTESPANRYSLVVEAPTHDGSPFHFDPTRYQDVHQRHRYRMREVTFLAGHLLRWYHLYGVPPDSNSRIWSWFPDSAVWKQATSVHGKDVVMNTLGISPF
jgi:hypothetical protein